MSISNRFVVTDWRPEDIANLNKAMQSIGDSLAVRPVVKEMEFTSDQVTHFRHGLGAIPTGVLVLSGNIQKPPDSLRATWTRADIYLSCSGTFPQNAAVMLFSGTDDFFMTAMGGQATSIFDQGVYADRPTPDGDSPLVMYYATDTKVLYLWDGSAWNAVGTTPHASTHLPAGTDPIDWSGTIHVLGVEASLPAASASNAGCIYFAVDTGIARVSDGATWTTVIAPPDLASVVGAGNTTGGTDIDFENGGGPINVLLEALSSLPSYTARRYFVVTNQLYGPKGVGNTYMPISFPPSTAARMMVMGG